LRVCKCSRYDVVVSEFYRFIASLDIDPIAQLLWVGFLVYLVHRFQVQTRRWQLQRAEEIRLSDEDHSEALRRALHDTAAALSVVMGQRDQSAIVHARRVRHLALAMGRPLGCDDGSLEGLGLAAALHDIGQVQVPFEILSRPRPLLPQERALVKQHAQAGFDVLRKISFPWPVADMVLQHHENFDGSGYPQQLSGERILLEARILRVADSLIAMLSHRPFRHSLVVADALAQLEAGCGTLYDPRVVSVCVDLIRSQQFVLETNAH
jgi:putative nucleotidyltransferase with HDIG domain